MSPKMRQSKDTKIVSEENIESIYFLKDAAFLLTMAIAIAVIAMIGLIVTIIESVGAFPTSGILWGHFVLYFIGLIMALALYLDATKSMLVLLPEGIRYETATYTIWAAWSDVVGIEQRAKPLFTHVLLLKQSTVRKRFRFSTINWLKNEYVRVWQDTNGKPSMRSFWYLTIRRRDLVIPLTRFQRNWYRGKLGESIQHFAPHLVNPSSL